MHARTTQHTRPSQPGTHAWPFWPLISTVVAIAALGLVLTTPHSVQAKTFHCGGGDVACLIAAITEANTNGQKHNTIRLAAGTYTLTAVTTGPSGLPLMTSALTIQGTGAETTVIEPAAGAPSFLLIQVAASGLLRLEGLTLRGGSTIFGGGIVNSGTVILTHSTVANNASVAEGGGIVNLGTLTLTHSTVANNGTATSGGGRGEFCRWHGHHQAFDARQQPFRRGWRHFQCGRRHGDDS